MSTGIRTSRKVDSQRKVLGGTELPLFRFGLRQLLVCFTLACLLMAAMAIVHAMTAMVLLLATLVVGLHLFSTALGSQLRAHANQPCDRQTPAANRPKTDTQQPATRSPWHVRQSTPLPWLPRLVLAASLLGGAAGVVLLSGTIGDRTSTAGIAVGSISLAVVAGWFAFVGYSFYGVFRHGLRDAMVNDDRNPSR